MRLSFKIASRFLTSSFGQTMLIVFGIAMGVSVQIFIGSLIGGLQANLINTTVGSSAQITVLPSVDGEVIQDDTKVLAEIKDNITGIRAAASISQSPGFYTVGEETTAILLRGVEFADATKIYGLDEKLISGEIPTNTSEILIGKELAEEKSLSVGDTMKLSNVVVAGMEFKIVGIYDLKVKQLNALWIFTPTSSMDSFVGTTPNTTQIELQVDDVFAADVIASDIQSLLGSNFTLVNWKAENESLLSGLNGQSASSYMIQFFVMISVVLAIASVLAISVVQKSKQIGILKAMGISNRKASWIFLFQGILLGVFGALCGVAIGIGLTYAFGTFVLNADGTPVVPVLLNFNFIIISASIAILASTFASLIPAIKVSRLDPIDVIRNG
ncbi:MAG: ABC transporter permease [Erysipelotrichaceae bacterium]